MITIAININLNLKDMKKLGKIKLNQFSKDELERRKMNALKGGCGCIGRGGCVGNEDACTQVWDDVASRNERY